MNKNYNASAQLLKNIMAILYMALIAMAATAQKPILPDFYSDPAVRVFDNTVWLYPTHDVPGDNSKDNLHDWHCFSSTDMEHWKDNGIMFTLKDISWENKKAYAADIIRYKKKYYFYFTANYQIGVAVSSQPDKGFKDALGKPLLQTNEGNTKTMDPCIFIDDDGKRYLYYGQNKLCVVKLKANMIEKDGDVKSLNVTNYHEGIYVHKRGNLYYLTYPSEKGDKVANLLEYSIGKSPLGPFEYKGVIMDNRSRNVHHSIIKIKNKWYIFYHVQSVSPSLRRVCVDYLEYNKDGTIKPIVMTAEGVTAIEKK